MGIFDRQIGAVKRLIAKYGQTVTFKHINPPIVLDPLKPWDIVDINPDVAYIKMVFLSPSVSGESRINQELLQYLSGSAIPSGAVRGYCASFEYIPKLNDIFIRDGNELTVKAIDTLAPNGQAILYTVEFDV